MPYMGELIYQNLNRKLEVPSVHLAVWPEKKELSKEQQATLDQMQFVRETVEQGHGARKLANIKLRQPLSKVTYNTKSRLAKEYEDILAEELNVKTVEFGEKFEFDLDITPELKQEGLARELERAVQELRKTTGLKVGEMAKLSYDTEDKELIEAFKLVDTKKTYISEVSAGKGGEEIELDGKKISLQLG